LEEPADYLELSIRATKQNPGPGAYFRDFQVGLKTNASMKKEAQRKKRAARRKKREAAEAAEAEAQLARQLKLVESKGAKFGESTAEDSGGTQEERAKSINARLSAGTRSILSGAATAAEQQQQQSPGKGEAEERFGAASPVQISDASGRLSGGGIGSRGLRSPSLEASTRHPAYGSATSPSLRAQAQHLLDSTQSRLSAFAQGLQSEMSIRAEEEGGSLPRVMAARRQSVGPKPGSRDGSMQTESVDTSVANGRGGRPQQDGVVDPNTSSFVAVHAS
jgi:hypothetical protein